MSKTIKSLLAEATEYGIEVVRQSWQIQLLVGKGTDEKCVSWIFQAPSGQWIGQTARPDITGQKKGSKVECLDWALDHAIEGWGTGENRHAA